LRVAPGRIGARRFIRNRDPDFYRNEVIAASRIVVGFRKLNLTIMGLIYVKAALGFIVSIEENWPSFRRHGRARYSHATLGVERIRMAIRVLTVELRSPN
jgi:hypothetical protein